MMPLMMDLQRRLFPMFSMIAALFFSMGVLVVVDANTANANTETNGRCCSASSKGSSIFDPLDVIVIGAGWSGLATAHTLHSSEYSKEHVCVLEARDAIGGRSRTVMGALVPDLPTELGSAWVWEGTQVANIFKDAGLVSNEAPSYFSYEDMGLYHEPYGGLIENGSEDASWLRAEYEAFEDYVLLWATHDNTIQQLYDWYVEDYPDLDPVAKQFIMAMMAGSIHSEFGSYLKDADAEFLDGHLTPAFSIDFVAVPNGGFSQALDHFATPFKDHIRLNTQVLEVDYMATNKNEVVKVTTLDRTTNTNNVYYARSVVCTVSLGVLKSGDLKFKPALPPRKQKAIEEMGMGNVNKCILYWDASTKDVSWWPNDKVELQLIPELDEDPLAWTYFINDQNHAGNRKNHILTAWIGGEQADVWENRTDVETVDHVMNNIRRMFPPPIDVPDPTNFVITRWKSDPFTRGTYHYHRAGVDTYALQGVLAETVDSKVFFAGEATNNGMSAPNAYKSGERAARKIIQSGVLDNVFSLFPNRSPICSKAAHRCDIDDDCCEGYSCQQRIQWSTVKHCIAAQPGTWTIGVGSDSGQSGGSFVRPRTSPLRGKD